MKALKFTLKGETAFFKKPDVNTYMYFTYGNLHKVALLGLLGAVLGLKGYSQQEGATYPEFYEVLKNLKVAIVPRVREGSGNLPGIMGKKVQTFNNSVGYASAEAGGNLIVKEQWLERPIWDVYIREGHSFYAKLVEKILNRQCVYVPYLGKNDHMATIEEECEVELEEIHEASVIQSLFLKSEFVMAEDDEEDFFESGETYYKYEEKLPLKLEPEHNQYEVATFIATNKKMKTSGKELLYQYHNQVLYFF